MYNLAAPPSGATMPTVARAGHVDFETLAVFAAVAETCSFTRGAARVHRTQPVASSRIARLEENVGTSLFARDGRAVRLTSAGQVLYGYARRLLALRAEAVEALVGNRGTLAGELRVGASTIPAVYLLPRWVARFHRRHPRVRLRVESGASADILRRVQEGDLDLGVVGDRARQAGLSLRTLPGDEIVLAVPRRHALSRAPRALPPGALRGVPLVSRIAGSGTRSVLERALARAGLSLERDFDVVCETASTASALAAVKAGVGVSFVSSLAVAEDAACRDIVVRRLSGLVLRRPFYLALPRARRPSRAAQAFAEMARGK